MHTPSAVISHVHMPIVRLQQHTIAPFIRQQQLHIELVIMLQRFCSIEHAIGSSQLQMIFMPPAHFSIFIWQRGIIIPAIGVLIAGIAPRIPAVIPGDLGIIAEVVIAVLHSLIPSVPPATLDRACCRGHATVVFNIRSFVQLATRNIGSSE
jgi:hypothetical protein